MMNIRNKPQELNMIRHKRLIGVGLLLVALLASACQAASSTAPAQLQTAMVTRGAITSTVSAAGTLAAKSQVDVAFETSGRVKTVKVKVGDRVKAGQVMASLATTELEASVASAQAGLDIAQARLAQTRQGPLESQIKSAEASLASAQAAYRAAQAKTAHLADQLVIEQDNLNNVSERLSDAQGAYNNLIEYKLPTTTGSTPGGRPSKPGPYVPPAGQEWSQEKAALDNAQVDYQVALAEYNLAAANVNDSSLQSAAAQVASAQTQLDTLKSTPTAEDLALAEQSVRQSQISLQQAQANLRKAQLIAPFDGVVAALDLEIGQQVAANQSAATLLDGSQLEVQIDVAETDIPRVKLGQSALITFDALPNQTFTGGVTQIALAGTTTQGVVNYAVKVVLDPTDATVRAGMTANVVIIVEQRESALLVPVHAIKTVENAKTVTVVAGGKQTQVNVTVGYSDDVQAEVTSGLNEGDIVIVQSTTKTNNGGFGPPGGGPGMP
jgi:HlyD family secretion protein